MSERCMAIDIPDLSRSSQSKSAWEGETRWLLYTAILLRCRARRALITLRPFLVDMRLRNPWVRLRDTLLGWKVRFIGPVGRE